MEAFATLGPRIWGHRGAMEFAPQNTIPSFEEAVKQGADGVELDVQLTKDGVLAVFHDAQVDALTDGHGPLAAYTWKDLQALDAGSHFGRDWAGTRIPTLEQVLAALPSGFFVNIELKTALSESTLIQRARRFIAGPRPLSESQKQAARTESKPLAEAVARLIGQAPTGQYIISSFDPFALEAFYEWNPRIPGSATIPLGFLHAPDMPWDTPAETAALPYRAWHPHFSQADVESVANAHSAGRKVHVWTVNDSRIARNLVNAGVDALITNRPGPLRESLTT